MYKYLKKLPILLIRMLLIAMFSATAASAEEIKCDGECRPDVLFTWYYDACGAEARSLSIVSENPSYASVHQMQVLTPFGILPGDTTWYYDGFPGGQHTNPYTYTVTVPILDGRFQWHYGYGGSDDNNPDNWIYTGGPDPCAVQVCNLVKRTEVVRDSSTGPTGVYDELWYTGMCQYVTYGNTSMSPIDRELWLGVDKNGDDIHYEWVYLNGKLVKHSFASPPCSDTRQVATLKSDLMDANGHWESDCAYP